MKIKPYVDKLYSSDEYKNFQKEHSNAYIAAGFFVLDLEAGKNIHQIDFYVPKEKKVAAFTLDKGITLQMMKMMNSKIPEKLDLQTKIDLIAIKGILEDEMKNRNITEEIKKIIAVLQNIDGKKIWNVNCVLSGMSILKANIEDSSETVLKMEKASIMDYVKKMNPAQLQKMTQEAGTPVATEGAAGANVTKIDPKEKLKKLQELEDEIEKEKAELQKGEKDVEVAKEVKKDKVSKPIKAKKK